MRLSERMFLEQYLNQEETSQNTRYMPFLVLAISFLTASTLGFILLIHNSAYPKATLSGIFLLLVLAFFIVMSLFALITMLVDAKKRIRFFEAQRELLKGYGEGQGEFEDAAANICNNINKELANT